MGPPASPTFRLPKKTEAEPFASALWQQLELHAQPLWPGGDLRVPCVELAPGLEAALRAALVTRRLVRGAELVERALAADAQGLEHVDRTTGVERGQRVSRLVVLADDGSQRFYRNAEALLRRHAPRVMALRLRVDEARLGGTLFGEGEVARMLMIDHKDAVAEVLRALALHWAAGPG